MSDSALKVGLLTASLTDTSGWSHYSLSLVRALLRAGVRLTVVAPRNSPLMDGVTVLPILPTVEPLQRGLLINQVRLLPQVRAALRDCTLIHAAVEPYAPLAALIAGSRRLIVTGHGSYVLAAERRRFPVNRIYAWAYRKSQMVCVSHYTARAVEAALPGIRTTVINNGVDFERFADIRHIGDGGVLSVGGVKARKGTLELVQAMTHVPDTRCTIVGSLTSEPDYTARVQAEIARLGLQDRVTLTGRIAEADLLRLYAEAAVFALPSLNVGWKFEGYGLATLEASAAGLPVISTRDCGAEDAILDGVTGFSIPQTDLEHGLADAINRLLQDRSLAETMGAAGRDHARLQTWDHVAAQMITLYKTRLG
ncbi:MAG TPA: glycosyltransferase family 4 protein [Phototrophicaceae bacterium]|nr:glycosyltransferase family 4 protein [Phototrophicaceae bacterium]